MDVVPYQTRPAARSTVDTALGWIAIAGVVIFIGLCVGQGGLADWADRHPTITNATGSFFGFMFVTHLIFVAVRLRHAWRRRDLPQLLGIAAIIDAFVLVSLVIGMIIDHH